MASDESEALGNGDPDAGPDGIRLTDGSPPRVALGTYTWEEFKTEFFYEDGRPPTNWRGKDRPFPAEEFLGFDPEETESRVENGAKRARSLASHFEAYLDPEETEVSLGNYLWEHFRYEYYYEPDREKPHERPRNEDGNVVHFDKAEWLGFEEAELPEQLFRGAFAGNRGSGRFEEFLDPETTPVTVGEYLWEHFRYEYYYEPDREKPHEKPRDEDGNTVEFDKAEWLGFEEDDLPGLLTEGAAKANELLEIEDERTLDVPEALDEDAFFSTVEGYTTVVNRYDLEKAVPLPKKSHFREIDRYWVNKPNSFVIIFHSEKENETKYYLIEPYRTRIEDDLREFLTGKLRSSIKYASDEVVVEAEEQDREAVIERETLRLLSRYDLYQLDDDEIAELLTELLTQYDSARETWNRYSAETRAQTGDAIRSLREEVEPYLERFRKPEEEIQDGADESESEEEDAEKAVEDEDEEQNEESTDADTDKPDANQSADDTADEGEVDKYERESNASDLRDTTEIESVTESKATPSAKSDTNLPAKTDEEALEDADSAGHLGELKGRWNDLLAEHVGDENRRRGVRTRIEELIEEHEVDDEGGELGGIMARPEPALLAEDADTLTEYQVEKLLYLLKRDFIGYERIDGVKHDINVEDISCDGYNSPVFVYHSDYEQIITNVHHGESELDDFVVKLAQRSGKGISKRQPQVDATLPDGSRAQLTLGREVSDHGTNYTIRQFKDVPFTPLDLINWNTFSLEEMASSGWQSRTTGHSSSPEVLPPGRRPA
ncbi:hypothetical protein SAMN05421858_1540 [Haladaptatus litoreus]|uniref:PilB3-like N-terminal domain-containing protein n=1 Tax=Haladaptatus litoreus TaxID=553468 RepID=A0A1N6YF45_9EURY|nr:hypothetical protein SAMN05421858_1540 [Haladaptatus litoreus]